MFRDINYRKKVFFFVSILIFVTSTIFTGINYVQKKSDDSEMAWMNLELESERLAELMETKLIGYKNLFQTVSSYSQIYDIVDWRKNNATLQDLYDSLNDTEKVQGDLYPQRINTTSLYKTIYTYFNQIYTSTDIIDMIRVFYKDGNILVGDKLGNHDMSDYKGDKSWFKDALEMTKEIYYISPISISRATNSPAIRILHPIIIDNEVFGILIINFNVEKITALITENDQFNEDFMAFIIDPAYENAEGDILGEVYIVNSENNSKCFQETTAGDIKFKVAILQLSINETKHSVLINNKKFYFRSAISTLDQRKWFITVAISEDKMFEESKQVLLRNVLLDLTLFIVITAIGVVISNNLVKPILDITKKAMLIAEGDKSIKIALDQSDEFGELSQAIEIMVNNLRELEYEKNLLLQSIDDIIIYFKNPELEIVWTNFQGTDLEKYFHQNLCYKIYGFNTQCHDCPVIRTFKTKKAQRIEKTTAEGQIFEIRTFFVCNQDNQLTGVLELLKDITKLKETEEKLGQSQKMEALGQLAGGIAHDFNNLMTVINGYSEFLLENMSFNSAIRNDLVEIKNAALSASVLTKQLLTFSRKEKTNPTIFNLNQAIQDSEKLLKRTIRENVEIKFDLLPDLGNIYADPGQIQQIIINLVINAHDAIKNTGIIILKTKKIHIENEQFGFDNVKIDPGEYITFSITDTGMGIDEEILPHIFEPFFTTKDPGKGTGLGLAIVYGNVLQNKGKITIYSKVGIGTKFQIYFPEVIPESLVPVISTSEKDLKFNEKIQNIKNYKILVIEDQESIRKVLQIGLEKYGFSVFTANNGIEALQLLKLKHNEIDIILSDLMMPKLGGKDLFLVVQKKYPQMKFLLMSGHIVGILNSMEIEEYKIHFLEKPFNIKTLIEKLLEL